MRSPTPEGQPTAIGHSTLPSDERNRRSEPPFGGDHFNIIPNEPLTRAARSARGAHPIEILARRSDLRHPGPVTHFDAYPVQHWEPELHPLDSEWYFTNKTNQFFAGLLDGTSIGLLGTPSVASLLSSDRFELYDSSPFLTKRFPTLRGCKVWPHDINGIAEIAQYDSILLDPPWYEPSLSFWLSLAVGGVDSGGRVLMPLFGEYTRPSSRRERSAILAWLGRLGDVEIIPGAVEYDIPLFESRALAANRVALTEPWRIADLVLMRRRSSPFVPLHNTGSPHLPTDWESFIIGSQVVRVRLHRNRTLVGQPIIQSIPDLDGFDLDTVSMRDYRLKYVDLWTSRNRVARVNNFANARLALSVLQGPIDGIAIRIERLRRELLEGEMGRLLSFLEIDSE